MEWNGRMGGKVHGDDEETWGLSRKDGTPGRPPVSYLVGVASAKRRKATDVLLLTRLRLWRVPRHDQCIVEHGQWPSPCWNICKQGGALPVISGLCLKVWVYSVRLTFTERAQIDRHILMAIHDGH